MKTYSWRLTKPTPTLSINVSRLEWETWTTCSKIPRKWTKIIIRFGEALDVGQFLESAGNSLLNSPKVKEEEGFIGEILNIIEFFNLGKAIWYDDESVWNGCVMKIGEEWLVRVPNKTIYGIKNKVEKSILFYQW